jgi:hypothetical protein
VLSIFYEVARQLGTYRVVWEKGSKGSWRGTYFYKYHGGNASKV